jgi:repressor LexA
MRDHVLTPRRLELLRFIHRRIVEQGSPPTLREMAGALGMGNASGPAWHLKSLAARGYVRLERRGTTRRVRLLGLVLVPAYSGDEAGRRLREALGG